MVDFTDSERRRGRRVLFETDVTVSAGGRDFRAQGSSKDLSLKGIYVRTAIDLDQDSICDVEIKLTGSTDEIVISANGKIVRKDENGLGIHFESIDLDSYVHLKNILKYNTD